MPRSFSRGPLAPADPSTIPAQPRGCFCWPFPPQAQGNCLEQRPGRVGAWQEERVTCCSGCRCLKWELGSRAHERPPRHEGWALKHIPGANAFSALASSPRAHGSCLGSLPSQDTGRETRLLTQLSEQAVTHFQGREGGASSCLSTGTATPPLPLHLGLHNPQTEHPTHV